MKGVWPLALGVLAIFATAPGAQAQDPQFSQFYANPLYLNPAFAGTAAGPRFALNYRNQWPSLSGSFQTFSASYDEHFDGLGGGIGAQIWYDKAGDGSLTNLYMSGMYSYHLNIKDDTRDYLVVKLSLQAAAFTRSIDFSKLLFGDQIHPRLGYIYPTAEKLPSRSVESTPLVPDFSAGAMAFTKKFYGGLAVHHLIEPSQSFFNNPASILPRRLTVHAGMQLPLDNWKREPNTFLSPNILVMRQSKFTQVNFGAYLIKNFFIAGLWWRQTAPNPDALIALVGVKQEGLKIGFSYDLTVSNARTASPGSFELSAIVELKKYDQRKKKKWRKLSCPDF